jgi:hypothetical protein
MQQQRFFPILAPTSATAARLLIAAIFFVLASPSWSEVQDTTGGTGVKENAASLSGAETGSGVIAGSPAQITLSAERLTRMSYAGSAPKVASPATATHNPVKGTATVMSVLGIPPDHVPDRHRG